MALLEAFLHILARSKLREDMKEMCKRDYGLLEEKKIIWELFNLQLSGPVKKNMLEKLPKIGGTSSLRTTRMTINNIGEWLI